MLKHVRDAVLLGHIERHEAHEAVVVDLPLQLSACWLQSSCAKQRTNDATASFNLAYLPPMRCCSSCKKYCASGWRYLWGAACQRLNCEQPHANHALLDLCAASLQQVHFRQHVHVRQLKLHHCRQSSLCRGLMSTSSNKRILAHHAAGDELWSIGDKL